MQQLASVNNEVINALVEKWQSAAQKEHALRTLTSSLESQLLDTQIENAQAAVERTVLQRDVQLHAATIEALVSQLNGCAAEAAEYVSQHLEVFLRAPLQHANAQRSTEAGLREAALRHLREFMSISLNILSYYPRRALEQELRVAEKDVALARIMAGYRFEQERSQCHAEEVDALLRLVRLLAERSRDDGVSARELLRAKAHVRRLENQLDLNGIVAANLPPDFEPGASEGSSSTVAVAPPAPSPVLRQVAPHFFALRMLAHKDITLSELVQSWSEQEQRIMDAESRVAQVEASVQEVRRDALVVHQSYLEERQRREIAERRITDMVRERIRTSSSDAIQQELNQLRWSYSQVMDDAAQLAVALKVAREEMAHMKAKMSELTQQNAQMKADAEVDQVAGTLNELRRLYDSKLQSLSESYIDCDTQREIAMRVAEERQAALSVLTENVETFEEGNKVLTRSLSDAKAKALALSHATGTTDDLAKRVEQCSQELHTSAEQLQRALAKAEERVSDFHRDEQEALRAFAMQLRDLSASFTSTQQQQQQQHDSLPQRKGTEGDGDSAHDTAPSHALALVQHEQATGMMRQVLGEALRFVTAHLETTDTERAHLLDASLSDAQYVSLLVDKLKETTAQRDRLRAQLKQSHDIIEQHHLTVVEHALLHEVPVDDSLDTAEAAEQILVLREQVAALQEVRQRALDEVNVMNEDRLRLEGELSSADRSQSVLVEQTRRLTDALHASFAREASLSGRLIALQERVQTLVKEKDTGATSAPCEGDSGGIDSRAASQQSRGSDEEDGTPPPLPEAPTTAAMAVATPPPAEHLRCLMADFEGQLAAIAAAIRSLQETTAHSSPTAPITATVVDGVAPGDVDSASAGVTDDLESDLVRHGVTHVATVLREVLSQAGLLRYAVRSATVHATAALAETAQPDQRTPEMQLALVQTRNLALEATVQQMQVEQDEMKARLHAAEEATAKAEQTNQRILAISKNLMDKQSRIIEENKDLRAQVARLQAEAAAAATAGAAAAVAAAVADSPPEPSTAMTTEAHPQEHMIPEAATGSIDAPPRPLSESSLPGVSSSSAEAVVDTASEPVGDVTVAPMDTPETVAANEEEKSTDKANVAEEAAPFTNEETGTDAALPEMTEHAEATSHDVSPVVEEEEGNEGQVAEEEGVSTASEGTPLVKAERSPEEEEEGRDISTAIDPVAPTADVGSSRSATDEDEEQEATNEE